MWGHPLGVTAPPHGVLEEGVEVTPSVLARVLVGVTSSDVYQSARRSGVRRLADKGLKLQEATAVSRLAMSDDRLFYGVDTRMYSGDRGLECNTEDVNTQVFGVATSNGVPVLDYREVMAQPVAALDLGAEGQIVAVERDWVGGLAVRGNGPEAICEVPVAYCASPCGGR